MIAALVLALQFGVAGADANGACAAFESPIASGAAVTLVDMSGEHQVIVTRLGAAVEHCTVLQNADLGGESYALTADLEGPAIAIAGKHRIRWRDDVAFVDDVRLIACTSVEGLHLEAWSGEKKLWSAYYYLGYDVEPTCAGAVTERAGRR